MSSRGYADGRIAYPIGAQSVHHYTSPNSIQTFVDSLTPSPSTRFRISGSSIALLLLVGVVATLRLYYCTQLPINSGDLPRHMLHAMFVLRDGLATAGTPLVELDSRLWQVSWAMLPYNYPPVALFFFVIASAISPTLFFAKLSLTVMEGVNAWLIGRFTEQRWLGAIYWASPASIWWVSHEGQFEPLQSLFLIGAIVALRRYRTLGFLLLALAIQVKLLAILLLPWFLFQIRNEESRVRITSLLALLIGSIPTLIAASQYSLMAGLGRTVNSLRFNPYFWNFLDPAIFLWNPMWLVVINQVVSYGLLFVLILAARRSTEPIAYFAPIAFVVLVKGSMLAQFWYFLQLPAFVLPLQERRLRFWLIALTPLLDVYSLAQMVVGPFGWTMGDYYLGFDVYRPLLLP